MWSFSICSSFNMLEHIKLKVLTILSAHMSFIASGNTGRVIWGIAWWVLIFSSVSICRLHISDFQVPMNWNIQSSLTTFQKPALNFIVWFVFRTSQKKLPRQTLNCLETRLLTCSRLVTDTNNYLSELIANILLALVMASTLTAKHSLN